MRKKGKRWRIKGVFCGNNPIKRGKTDMNMLTKLEAETTAELMTMEENLCKKSALYSRIFTDTDMVSAFKEISKNSRERFILLYQSLGGKV